MQILFPDSRLIIERFLALPKSIVAIRNSGQVAEAGREDVVIAELRLRDQ
jgi:hypothetical protein